MGILSPSSIEEAALGGWNLVRSMHSARESALDRDELRHFAYGTRAVLRRPNAHPAGRVKNTFGKPDSVSYQEVSRA